MRKILSGILGIALTLAVVGGVAYAQFSNSAAVEGVSFSSGTSALHVWNGSAYVPSWNTGWAFNHLFPGAVATPTDFWLENDSDVAVNLAVTGQLRNGVTGDWDSFKNDIWVAITNFGVDPNTIPNGDWYTLNLWNSGGAHLATGTTNILGQGVQNHYAFNVKVNPNAGNEIQSKTLSDVNFDFTGTQTP